MPATFHIAIAIVYGLISLFLFVFGTNLVTFALRVWKRGPQTHESQPLATTHSSSELPLVTVQLPIYNELYVSERVIAATCALDYPRELLQIQVLDDSTDETTVLIAQVVEQFRADGFAIEHIHRTDRTGYKAGALAEGLKTATGELVAIFDADFVPTKDFLTRTVGHFENPKLAFVQARWGHVNRDYSWLTRLQALAIDGHFLVEQAGRGEAGYWFNFNGTAGIWRTAAIEDAGGWKADTLTEDLDLSYRAYLSGWDAHYLEDLVVPAELPAQMQGFRRQQHRWARGSVECAFRLLPKVWRTTTSPGRKFQATMHLTAYGIHLLLLMLTLIYPFVLETSMRYPRVSTLFGISYLLAATSLAPTVFFVTGRRQGGLPWVRELPRILLVSVFGSGLMVNTGRAVLQILTRKNPEFERTAKFGIAASAEDPSAWTHKRYQLDIDRIVVVESLLAAYSFWTAWQAWHATNWGIMIWATVFGTGLVMVVASTVAHSIAVHRSRLDRKAQMLAEREALDFMPAEPASAPTPASSTPLL